MIKVGRAYPRAWQASACLSGGMGRMKNEDCRVLIFEVGGEELQVFVGTLKGVKA